MKWIERPLQVILFLLMSLLTVSVIWQVISRYVLNNPAAWPDEVSRFAMTWVAILGGVYVYCLEKHLAVTILPELLKNSQKGPWLQILFHMLVLLLGYVMLVGGYDIVMTNIETGQLSPILHINMGYIYACVPLAGALLAGCALIFSYRDCRRLFGY